MKNKGISPANRTFFNNYGDNLEKNKQGVLVFKDTQLSVFYVGSLLTVQSKVETLEQYPYLSGDDLLYARLYYVQQVDLPVEQLAKSSQVQVQNTIEKFRRAERKEISHDQISTDCS